MKQVKKQPLGQNTMNGNLEEFKIEKIEDISNYIRFVKSNPNNDCLLTIAHNPSLGEILSKTFGYKYSLYYVIYKGVEIGVFPMYFIKNKSVSVPHFSYGGAYVKQGYEKQLPLINTFITKYFQNSEIRAFTHSSNYYINTKVATFLKLERNESEQLKDFSSNHRRKINKSYKNGLQTKKGGIEFLNQFYNVYSSNMHRLGSPPLPITFFKNLLIDYNYGESMIYITYHENEAVGVAFVLEFEGFTEDCWLSTNSKFNKLYVSYQLYWEMIKDAINSNKKYFSFGRSTKNSSLHNYKKHWKPIEAPIYFNYSDERTTSVKNFEILSKVWKLQPLVTANYFGGLISKYVY